MKTMLLGLLGAACLQFCVSEARAQDIDSIGTSSLERMPFASQAAIGVIENLCTQADERNLRVDIVADTLGWETSSHVARVAWALAPDATAWEVPSVDGRVFAYAYGPDMSRCGALIDFAITGGVKEAVVSELKAFDSDYAVIQESEMAKGASFVRLHAVTSGRYVDVIEYPGRTGVTGVVKVEYLPG